MERGTRKQVLINKIAFLEGALRQRDIKIAELQRQLAYNKETTKESKTEKVK